MIVATVKANCNQDESYSPPLKLFTKALQKENINIGNGVLPLTAAILDMGRADDSY